jgi:hypothetical protein
MLKPVIASLCLAASLVSLDARAADARRQDPVAQDEHQYSNGPVTEIDYIHVEYGHFDEYVAWLNSTWKPTMEALKKAGVIIDYKVLRADPKSPDQPNIFLMLTFKDMASYAGDIGDRSDALDAVADKVICSATCQNNARVARNEYRKVLGNELVRELILK